MARFVVLVIDSFGVGAMKDVTLVRPQDAGANTCGHILSQLPHLQLPTLEKLGLINALGYAPGDMQPSDSATWGVAELQHEGGDTFMGHQEILGTRPLPPLRMPYGVSWQNLVDSQRIMDITLNEFNTHPTAFICTNIQETDLAGHAEDVARYAERLQVVDRNLARLVEAMQPDDCLVVMADHGNDPTIGHSHHTREVVPVLVYQQGMIATQLGVRTTLSDVGATVCEFFRAPPPQNGRSFLSSLRFAGDTL
ncbi:phosphopentomutase [Escherichia coli]|nr:phosphopentomutase [Escherichia coli]